MASWRLTFKYLVFDNQKKLLWRQNCGDVVAVCAGPGLGSASDTTSRAVTVLAWVDAILDVKGDFLEAARSLHEIATPSAWLGRIATPSVPSHAAFVCASGVDASAASVPRFEFQPALDATDGP